MADSTSQILPAHHKDDAKAIYQQDRLMAALAVVPTTEYEEIEGEIKDSYGEKNVLSILSELAQYLRTTLNYVEVFTSKGPMCTLRFTMTAVLGGQSYYRCSAKNKKLAQIGSSYFTYKLILREELNKVAHQMQTASLTFEEKVEALSHQKYLQAVERCPQAFSGRKTLAAILLEEPNKQLAVVALGMGNRCIKGSSLQLDGSVVHDSHAEVLARRAFVRYLYNQIEAWNKNPDESILSADNQVNRLTLKQSYKVHLYISTSPCGDATVFNKPEFNADKPLRNQSTFGVLRSKLESGEGAIPVGQFGSPTLLGLQFGIRLRTMSCSDKLLKWNTLGLQGALLSNFLQAVYLSSVTIGSEFCDEHMRRAIFGRLFNQDHMCNLPAPFHIVQPNLAQSSLVCGLPQTQHTNAVAMHWHAACKKPQVFDGVHGKANTKNDQPSVIIDVCKQAIFQEFRRICNLVNQPDLLKETYWSSKMTAQDYQVAKTQLYQCLSSLGLGRWVKKPQELELFSPKQFGC